MYRARSQTLQEQVATAEATAATLKAQNEALQRDVDHHAEGLEAATSTARSAQASLERAEARVEELQASLDALRRQKEELEQRYDDVCGEAASLRAESARLAREKEAAVSDAKLSVLEYVGCTHAHTHTRTHTHARTHRRTATQPHSHTHAVGCAVVFAAALSHSPSCCLVLLRCACHPPQA